MQNQYTQAVENLQSTFNKWFEDINYNEKQLAARKQKGETYSFLEININYSKIRINACMALIQESNAYINFLHSKIEALQKNNNSSEDEFYSNEENIRNNNRTLIANMPQSPETMHNEVLQYLISISEQLDELKTINLPTPF
ncbi:MAG: hypothetical protein JST29_05625 [Bacteroidetes bacterium]|nr:hypothetical protein [Bacteroidota bacterium]